MSLLSRIESKFGRYAVPNLTLVIISGQALLYMFIAFGPDQRGETLREAVRLRPEAVVQGEWWRLITFIFDPPQMIVLFAIIYWYLFYFMGTTLESIWNSFRYNLFLGIGYLASIAASFGLYFASGSEGMGATNLFLYGSVFLAFARLYPDFTLMLMFILPVKIKWLAMLQWIYYGLAFLAGPNDARAMIVASVLNFLLFFGREIWRDIRYGHRRMRYQARTARAPQRLVHKCRTCGLTSDDAPQTSFRYCSQCADGSCYCEAHLRNHEHVVSQKNAS